MADLVEIPFTRDLVHAQIFTARLRASGFQVELLEYRDDGAGSAGTPAHLLVHAADVEEITAILDAEDGDPKSV